MQEHAKRTADWTLHPRELRVKSPHGTARVLLERCVDSSHRAHSSAFCEILRIWAVVYDIGSEADTAARWRSAIEAMLLSHLRGASGRYEIWLEPQTVGTPSQPGWYRRSRLRVADLRSRDAEAKFPHVVRLYAPAAQAAGASEDYTVLRWYTVDAAAVRWICSRLVAAGKGCEPPRPLTSLPMPFRIAPNEQTIANMQLDKVLVMLSRSGTGKTTTLLARMENAFLSHWNSGTARPLAPRRILFCTRNPVLRFSNHREFWAAVQSTGSTGIAADGSLQYPFPLEGDRFPSQPYVPPQLTSDHIAPHQYPLFLSLPELVGLLDVTLPGKSLRQRHQSASTAALGGGSGAAD